jgi:thiamine-monophosphate kinase
VGVGVSRIGELQPEPGLRLVDGYGVPLRIDFEAFDHFLTP